MSKETTIQCLLKHLTALSLAVALFPATSVATETAFYVSPTGNDANPGTEIAPVHTLARARDLVRTINSSMGGDIHVFLRGGTYSLTNAIAFEPQDSGTGGFRIFYEAYPGEVPVLDGSVPVTGWTQHSGNIYQATLSRSTKLRSLIVNGKRAYMASKTVTCQGPWGAYNVVAGQADWAWISGSKPDGATYLAASVPALANAEDVELVNHTTWNQNIIGVREITTEGSSRVLKFQQPMGAIAQNQGWGAGFATSGSHRVQNAFEFLDSPGEFYFNRSNATLYYYAQGEDMTTAVVQAPVIETLINIAGTSKTERVRNITFKGITFANTEAALTQVGGSFGKTTCQGGTWCKAFANTDWHADKYRAYAVMPGIINVTSADAINFIGNTLTHVGNEGICLVNDVSYCELVGNSITDIGGSGIQVGHFQHIYEGDGGTHEQYPPAVEGVCRNNAIINNYIADTTVIYPGHSAITAFIVDSLIMEHNHIEGCNYGGVSVGWGWKNWDEVEFPATFTTTCRSNKFNFNRILDCMKTLNDSGAYYTIGAQPGSEANNNYVKASTTHFQGVYHPDEGTAWYTGSNLVFEVLPGQDNFELNDWGRKHDNHYNNIYSTSSAMLLGAPNCTVSKLHVYPNADWPQEARDIIASAGLEPAYQYLIPPPVKTPAYAQIEAEDYDAQSNTQTENCSEGGMDVGYIQNGSYLVFRHLDFGRGAVAFNARVASGSSGGSIEVRLDSLTGSLIGTCAVPGNGGWQTWTNRSCPVSGAAGVHDVFLKFTGSGFLFNVNWFKFTPAPELGITQTAAGLTLSWALASEGFAVQSTADLTLSNWNAVAAPTPMAVGGQWQVTLPLTADAPATFYRLAK